MRFSLGAGSSRFFSRTAGLVIGFSLLVGGIAAAAPLYPKAKPGREVKDLHYGDVLFYYFQDNYFEAITRLTAARAMGRAEAHHDDGDLLLGGMLLSYGMHQQAAEIFQQLLDRNAKPDVRDRAWYYLAQMAHRRGADDEAMAALDHVKGPLIDKALEAERQMLRAEVLMAQNRNDEAAASLAAWKAPDDWQNYALYNRGIALIRAQHVEEGLALLAQAGSLPLRGLSEEQLALRDRANLAFGYKQIESNQPQAARDAFLRVRLEGPYSNKALLGLGWSDSELHLHSESLVPWLELKKRDILDPAVEESLLAAPYAMARMEAYGQAATAYEDAIQAFNVEHQRLDASIERIRSGQLLEALLKDDKLDKLPQQAPEQMGSDWRLKNLPHSEDSRYLVELLASHRFQEGLKNYRDLRFLQANLRKWAHDIAVFSDMLATQKLAYAQREPHVEEALSHVDLDAITQQRNALADRLAKIQADQDAVGLANSTELGQWQRLNDISARIDRLGAGETADNLREQQRLLKGVLLWNLDHDYKLRLWQQQRGLSALDDALGDAQQGRKAVNDARQGQPERLASFGEQIDQQTPRIAELLQATDSLLTRQQNFLQELAVQELQTYQQRLQSYSLEARYALAQIYDRAADKAVTAPRTPPKGENKDSGKGSEQTPASAPAPATPSLTPAASEVRS